MCLQIASREPSEDGKEDLNPDRSIMLPSTENTPIPAEDVVDAPLSAPVAAEPEQSTTVTLDLEPEPGWHIVTRRTRKHKPQAIRKPVSQPALIPTSNKETEVLKEKRNKEALESWKAFQEEKARKEAEEKNTAKARMAKEKRKQDDISSRKEVMNIQRQRAALIVDTRGNKKEVSCWSFALRMFRG